MTTCRSAAGQLGSPLNQLLGTFSYSYSNRGNVTAITESGTAARNKTFTYDAPSSG